MKWIKGNANQLSLRAWDQEQALICHNWQQSWHTSLKLSKPCMPSRKYVTIMHGHDMSEQIAIPVSMPKMRHPNQIISKCMSTAIDKCSKSILINILILYLGLMLTHVDSKLQTEKEIRSSRWLLQFVVVLLYSLQVIVSETVWISANNLQC